MHSKEAIALPEDEAVAQSVVEGICALMYALPPEITLHLDFRRRKLEPHGLVTLSRALRSTVASMNLSESDFAKQGNDLLGLRFLCDALGDAGRRSGLRMLDLSENRLAAGGCRRSRTARSPGPFF